MSKARVLSIQAKQGLGACAKHNKDKVKFRWLSLVRVYPAKLGDVLCAKQWCKAYKQGNGAVCGC